MTVTTLPVAAPTGGDLVSGTSVPRSRAFAGLAFVLFLNGIARPVVDSVVRDGVYVATMGTFGVSAVVWVALVVAVRLLWTADASVPATSRDLKVMAATSLAAFVPVEQVTWFAMTLLCAYAVWTEPRPGRARRGAVLMAAVTFPMFWSKLVFFALVDRILELDAVMANVFLRSERVGNVVRYADGSGFLWIAPQCSSFANVSLAVLCWAVYMQSRDARPTRRTAWTCVAACVAVVAVNAGRIALIGFRPDLSPVLHDGYGFAVAGWMVLGAMVTICSYGIPVEDDHL